MPEVEDTQKKDQGPPGPPGKLGQHGQPVSIFCLLKARMYFRKGNSNSSHMHKGLKLYSLTHCHQVYFYKTGFKSHQINSRVSYLPCMCQEIYKGLTRYNNQQAQGKQLMCQYTNILEVVMPQTLWAAFTVLHHTPSCHVQNCWTLELICSMASVYPGCFTLRILLNYQHKCIQLSRGAKQITL